MQQDVEAFDYKDYYYRLFSRHHNEKVKRAVKYGTSIKLDFNNAIFTTPYLLDKELLPLCTDPLFSPMVKSAYKEWKYPFSTSKQETEIPFIDSDTL